MFETKGAADTTGSGASVNRPGAVMAALGAIAGNILDDEQPGQLGPARRGRARLASFLNTLLCSQPTILLACLLPALWLATALFLQRVYDQTLESARTETGNLAQVLAEEAQSSVLAVDRTLVDLRERWQEEPDNFAVKVRLRQSQINQMVAFGVIVLDAGGKLAFSNFAPEGSKTDYSDRDYFTALRDGSADTLFINRPVTGRLSGRRGIQFARPLINADGHFAGVIAVSVTPEYFLRFSHKMVLGRESVLLLVRSGGQLLARSPTQPNSFQQTLTKVPYATAGAPPSGAFRAVSQIDGIERQYAWHTLSKYGLTVAIGRSTDDLLGPYWRVRQAAVLFCGVFSLLLVWICIIVLRGIHERAEARKALEESEFRWKYALEGSGLGVWDLDYTTGTGFFSNRTKEMLGYGEHEINTLGDWESLIHPNDKIRVLAAMDNCRSGATQGYAIEYRLRRGDGSWRWILSRGLNVAAGKDGKLLRMIGTHVDISDRVAAEQAVRAAQAAQDLFRSDQRFRQLADAMPQIVWTAEPDGRIDYGNRVLTEYAGLATLSGLEQSWTGVLHPDDVARTLAAWGHAVRTSEPLDIEYRIFSVAVGSYRWHQVRALPIRDDSGMIVKWYGTATDNHDSKLANDEIRRLACGMSTILESITDAYYSLDAEWRFTYVNKEAERMLNRSRESLVGKVLWDEYPELVGGLCDDEYRQSARAQCPSSFEFFYPPTNYWFIVRVSPSSEGVTVYFDDITERRRMRLFKDEQTGILEKIAAGAPLSEVLLAATRIVTAADPLARCAVMLLSEDGKQLRHAVSSRLPADLERALDGTVVGPASLPCGRAAYERQPVIAADLSAEPLWNAPGQRAPGTAIRASLSYPILGGSGEVFGTFDVYTSSAHAPAAAELEILGSCAHTISIAIGRERSEQKARKSEARLRLLQHAIEASANPIAIRSAAGPDYAVEYVNPAFERITGYAAAEVVGKSLLFLYGDDLGQDAIAELQNALVQQREGHASVRTYRQDGKLVWLDSHCSPVRDDSGLVTHFLNGMSDISAIKQYQAELEYQADYDTVTGLASHALLVNRAGAAVARAADHGSQAWIVCIELDRFQLVNETLGQRAADLVLQLLAHRVQGVLSAGDTAARIGGDEIVLLFADANDEHSVVTKVRRIMAAIAAPLPVNGHDYFLSSSVGIAAYPADGDNAETLVKNAHIAMRRAKEVRSNRLEFFTASMNERAVDRLRLECDLRHALERNELVLHYQPQVDGRTGRIVGMEALLRWQHPELGMVPPDRFIRIAEETGLIVPIGAWVMRTACVQAKQWQGLVAAPLRVAVNLAASQLYHDDLIATVTDTLADSGLEPHCLDIELTESQVMADVEHALGIMQRLKALGVKLSLDDFGTGYSSLSYLKRFPIDVLKIDQSFVRNLATDPDEAVIARSIITLGQSLQLQVIAEGVETEEQFAYLQRHRCDLIQGYYFSRPLPAAEFARLLTSEPFR